MFQVIEDQSPARSLEFIEKKGRGHPDSLADSLAEIISYAYADYCIENFGAVLHHYVDKLVLLGGEARATIGDYAQIRAIRVLLNGRFSQSFGRARIPVVEIARQAVKDYLPLVLPLVEDDHWEVIDNTNPSTGSSAKGWQWWAPRDLRDLPELSQRRANDTSVSVATAPFTAVESAVLEAEQLVFERFCVPLMCGSDIKILAARAGLNLHVTACVPVIATAVSCRSDYDAVRQSVQHLLIDVFSQVVGIENVTIDLNTRDDVAPGDIYLLGLGTALEHGDEGVVGRGNRTNGLITTDAPMSLDAPWGKNPVYFTGRVFDGCSRSVSSALWEKLSVPNSTYLASQNGRAISDPWRAVIRVSGRQSARLDDIGCLSAETFTESLRLRSQLAEIRSRYPHLPPVNLT